MKSKKRPCNRLKVDGTPCQAAALRESGFCFFHDPSRKAERRAAQTEGGRQNRMKTLSDEVPDIKIRDSKDVVALLSDTINQVRKGHLDPRVANSVGCLANLWVRVREQSELENRIDKLEQLLEHRTSIPQLLLTGTEKP